MVAITMGTKLKPDVVLFRCSCSIDLAEMKKFSDTGHVWP